MCSDICPRTLSVPRSEQCPESEASSRKIVSSEELIMSKGKYPSVFLKPNGDDCVHYPSNIFRNAHLGNITGYFPVFSHVIRLDQSHASENI